MIRVVLIDDEDIIIEGMKMLIPWNENGYEIVGVAYDGEEALEMIEKTEPDIVITDIRMPILNGLEMISKIKEINKHLIIMIMSGYSDFSYAKQAMEKGVCMGEKQHHII